jgi:hypothetical protein
MFSVVERTASRFACCRLGEDLFAVHVDRAGRLDSQPYLVTTNLEHRHDDLVTDHDALVGTPGEHEHGSSLRGAAVEAENRA